jgi:dimethylamine/trimethylamine dehydrogenase
MSGARPGGRQVVLFDDDHYYLGGVLAELLATEGHEVALVTPEPRVSEWTVNTLEQHRIQRRLLELGVDVLTSQTLVGAGSGHVRTACVYTAREREHPCDSLLLVTARLPEDALADELRVALGGKTEPSVRLLGDAWSPGTIAAAVWDGHRYAEELDEPPPGDDPPFLREVVALAPLPRST